MSAFPFRFESYASQRPSAEAPSDSIVCLPKVICRIAVGAMGSTPWRGAIHTFELVLNAEYASVRPSALSDMVWGFNPVVRRTGDPLGSPFPLTA